MFYFFLDSQTGFIEFLHKLKYGETHCNSIQHRTSNLFIKVVFCCLSLPLSAVRLSSFLHCSNCRFFFISFFSIPLKGTQAWNFFFTFFVETETLWSQGPVTRDFWKSYLIRPRYSNFKHFRACSACDEIGSAYAQHAMKLVPRMLGVRYNSFCVCSAWIVHVTMFTFYRWLSMRGNSFLVCSACDEIVSAYAQHTHAIIFENDSKIPN
jgi:hypothetical protein